MDTILGTLNILCSENSREDTCFIRPIMDKPDYSLFKLYLLDNFTHSTHILAIINEILPDCNITFIDMSQSVSQALCTLLTERKKDSITPGLVLCAWEMDEADAEIIENYNKICDMNTVFVASAGNTGLKSHFGFPASQNKTIIVGSHDEWGMISNFSGHTTDRTPDFYALGRNVNVNGNILTGTSFSAAIVFASIAYFTGPDDINSVIHKFTSACNVNSIIKKDHSPINPPYRTPFIGNRYTITGSDDIIGDYYTIHRSNTDFLIEMQPVSKEHGTYKEELVKYINSINTDSIIVPMSGGIDSEIVCECAIQSNKTVIALTMRIIANDIVSNADDIQYAIEYCKENNVKHQFIDLDMINFIESGDYYEYCVKYYTSSYQLAAHLWMMDQIDGVFVFPGNMASRLSGSVTVPPIRYFCYDFYAHKNNKLCVPRLLAANGQIIRAGWDGNQECHISEHTKYDYYERLGFTNKRRQPLTGFENVISYFDTLYSGHYVINSRCRTPLQRIIEGNLRTMIK